MSGRFGVVGKTAAHSLSPWLHQCFARQTQRETPYAAYAPPPGKSFSDFARDFFAEGGRGLNVTVPYKKEAIEFVVRASAFCRRAEAANVLTLKEDGVVACNTDGAGLIKDLTENCGQPPDNKRVLIAGAGGAARAATLALAERGCKLTIAARKLSAAESLSQLVGGEAMLLSACEGGYEMIFNATSGGWSGEESPLSPSVFRGALLAYDLNYGEAARPFLLAAAAAKLQTDGLGMLAEQAALSFAIWRGVLPSAKIPLRLLRQ